MMDFSCVRIVDPYVDKGWTPEIRLTLATPEEVDSAETELGCNLPAGYRDYVTTFGLGEYCSYIRIDMPSALLSEYKNYQRFLDEYWFWDLGKGILTKQRAIESIKFGGTDIGDTLIFHPTNPGEIFVLPRQDDMLYKIGTDLYEVIDWLCTDHSYPTGFVGEEHRLQYFVPHNPFAYTHGRIRPENI